MRRFQRGTLGLLVCALAFGACSAAESETWPEEPQEAQNPGTPQGPTHLDTPFTLSTDVVRLGVEIVSSTATLTPIQTATYSERSTSFSVKVSGFANEADAERLGFGISYVPGLVFRIVDTVVGGERVFEVGVEYDGERAFVENFADIRFRLLAIPEGYEYVGGTQSTRIAIRDGQAKPRSIPLRQGNIEAFNEYANTAHGLTKHYRLSQPIALTPPPQGQSNWKPIGAFFNPVSGSGEDTPFTGSLDGAGLSLSGLTVYATDSGFYGMFGALGPGAVVENLGLTGGSVEGEGWVGGVAGENRGTVQKCHTTGDISAHSERQQVYIGGVVGQNSGTVQHCSATGLVQDKGAFPLGSVGGDGHTGGVVGHNSGTVRDCQATGPVTGGTLYNHSDGYTGGVVGFNKGGTVQDSHATGTVTGNNAGYGSASYAGGVVGLNEGGEVKNCYAKGNVSSETDYRRAFGAVGGVVGANEGGGKVKNCYAKGTVTGVNAVGGVVGLNESGEVLDSHATGDIFAGSGSEGMGGGVVGWNRGTVQNCYATGKLTPQGVSSLGGVVGWNSGTVQSCYATSDIASWESPSYTGGVVGSNTGTVQNCYAAGEISGSMTGGVVGVNVGKVKYSYAKGKVTGSSFFSYTGGVVGWNYGDDAEVRSCMALNPAIIGSELGPTGRVVGLNDSALTDRLSGNIAFEGISNREGNTYWWDKGAAERDGEDRTAEALQTQSGFAAVFVASPWTYAAGRLPGLFGQPVDMPSHIY